MFIESYERKLKGNSLILKECSSPEKENKFEERMITENTIKGFLPCTIRMVDDSKEFMYDITSKQSYYQLFEERELKEKDISRLISGIINIQSELEDYLLKDDNLVLNPQFLYLDYETKNPSFVFYPYYNTSIHESLMQLGLFILEKTDHNDEKAVKLAYGFYKCIVSEDYAFNKLLYADNQIDNFIPDNVTDAFSEKNKDNNNSYQIIKEETAVGNLEEPDEIEVNISIKNEKMVLIGSSVILIILIAVLVGIKVYNLNKYIPIKDNYLMGVICFIGSICVSVPIGMLINQTRKEKRLNHLRLIKEEVINKEKRRDKKPEKLFGNTDELANNNCVKRLVCYDNEEIEEIRVNKTPFILGKNSKDVDGYINNSAASRIHAKIEKKRNEYYLTDCNSTNGTSVNGKTLVVNECVKIHDNDEISFAGKVFYFR